MSNLLFGMLALAFVTIHFSSEISPLHAVEKSFFTCALIVLMLYDLRQWRVPISLSLAAIAAGVGFGMFGSGEPTFGQRLIGAALGFIFLWCVLIVSTWLLRKSKFIGEDAFSMGAGDPLMIAVIGSFMGFAQLPQVIFLGSLQACLAYPAMRMAPQLASRPSWALGGGAMPLAAFLALAALEILLLGRVSS